MSDSMENGAKILAVDDDPFNLRIVQHALEQAGFRVYTAQSGETALAHLAEKGLPHLAIVDIHMPPGMSGFEFCYNLHQFSDVPVVMLTAVNEEGTVVQGLEEHAEDYVTKPFKPGELVARVKGVLRRMGTFAYDLDAVTRVDERLQIDFPRRQALVYGEPVTLTPTETKLLFILMRAAGHTVNTDFILRRLWPNEPAFEDRLHVHLHRLRRKIEDKDKSRPRYITSERGLGYVFRASVEPVISNP
ncbi:MAG: response regulator transcription factor [Chloroflexi bacterium]|nr:response regulator transcription factor [Ardenticatenaceae bacterium]NOG36445.1 response regulator transcription factor [Chloroflexota bacterium]GIK57791.1 MAG: DNA-binding response regulator [Chloroflexota bacterium]